MLTILLEIHYLSGAMLIQNNGKDSLLYTDTDNQGSLAALTDESGNVVERYAFDPWGARRNPDQWEQKDTRTKWITNRGYTGHEHLDAFGIINMNGRVYDPATGMFFSPDPFMQSPGDWVNFNRYSYCMGNPMRYTDPSGYVWDGVGADGMTAEPLFPDILIKCIKAPVRHYDSDSRFLYSFDM
jgi:RHS repeat-associated protein